jgi:hypothetical protein
LIGYRERAIAAATLFIPSMAIALSLAEDSTWEPVATVTCTVTYWYAFWAFAKSKGYSGFIGLGLATLNILGLIIILVAGDKISGDPDA